jgi:uncharacterized protein with von Willebrand factor type A (vWA) domain
MFTDFLYTLRAHGLKVSTTEWLSLLQALSLGHGRADLATFYHLGRALLVKSEALYDRWDVAFAAFFEGVDQHFDLSDDLLTWLQNPVLPRELTADERAALQALDLDELRRRFEERLREQKERHDGGSHWVGTGGTSPFGSGGTHPTGIRVGTGGRGMAAQVVGERRFANLRTDRVLDHRQMGVALRRLRRWGKDGQPSELDVPRTIDRTCREGGEITLQWSPPRRNRLKVLLLMDVGGSMDAHTRTCEALFTAARQAHHFRALETWYFHNCPYETLFSDMAQRQGEPTLEVLGRLDETWRLLVVGDASMHPMELVAPGGAIDFHHHNDRTGLWWLQTLRQRMPHSVWLNPMAPAHWQHTSIRLVHGVFPMFPLTVDGLTDAVDALRGRRPAQPLGLPRDLVR